MGILGMCFAAIVGLVGYLWWSSQPLVLEGTLEGETVSATNIRPVAVDVVSVSQSIRESVLDGLQELPYSLKSSLVVTEFRAANGQLEIRLVPTTTTTIVRINPKEDSQLAGWLSTQQAALAATRQADLLEATDRFFDDYAAYKANGTRMGDGGYYRNQLGLASTNVSLGYVVEAIAANQACPCVFEDSGGALYFVVPRGTASFTVRGRKLSDGTKPFPGTYTVDCSAIRESFEVIEPPSDSKAEASSEDSETKLEPTDTDEPPAMDAKPSDKMEMEPEMNGMSEMDGMNQ